MKPFTVQSIAGDKREAMVETDERQEILTVDEVIRWLRLGRTRTNELLRSGSIPSFKVGRRRLVRRTDVEAWLEEHRADPSDC
jgi:excisionase family DNA binding protein